MGQQQALTRASGTRGDQPARPMAISQQLEVYSAKVEAVNMERGIANAPDSQTRYNLLKQTSLYLCSLIQGLKKTPENSEYYDRDIARATELRRKIIGDKVPIPPLPTFNPYATEDPVTFEVRIEGSMLSICTEASLPLVMKTLMDLRAQQLFYEGVGHMYDYWYEAHEILSRHGVWDADATFKTTETGYDREKQRQSIAATREAMAAGSRDDDDDDDDDDDPTG